MSIEHRKESVSIVSSSVSKNPLVPGQVQSASVTLTSTTTRQGLIVDIRIYNTASDSMYARKEFNPVNIPAGGQQVLTFDFQSPTNMPQGQYDVRVGVWDTSWNTLLYASRDAFTVSSGGGGGTPISVNCQDGVLLPAGSYVVENNQWGKDGVVGSYSQCVGNGGVAADGSVSALDVDLALGA
jgi:hypothetical protein